MFCDHPFRNKEIKRAVEMEIGNKGGVGQNLKKGRVDNIKAGLH